MNRVGDKLVIATHNSGKLREIRALVARFGIECVGAAELDLPEPEETGTSFVANAELKARAAADLTGLPALSDDSGLSVDALNGEPGIHSARWAEDEAGDRDFGRAMEKVEAALLAAGPEAGRDAHFTCALSLAWPDGTVESFEGKVFGHLVWPSRGDHGFGYDPVFVPHGHEQTFGEMAPEAKHAMSHRAKAFELLVDYLKR
ncbi:RdgB/HAM1 family non-canonical purine NTP pyrophosphatase [Sphingomonas humi]|uniref:dITP/XTP pyrophosphatase n=1 Tax=Sphingomonas humi TaxID=335630 RepID=A0ABP7S1Z9_9SPHN